MARTSFGILSLFVVVLAVGVAQTRSVTPVATVGQIQRAMVSPSSDIIFNVGSEAPETDSEWQVVENAAVILAEAGNLFMMDGRRQDEGLWMELAGAMADAGANALSAAEARDVDGVLHEDDGIVVGKGHTTASKLLRCSGYLFGFSAIGQGINFSGFADIPILTETACQITARRSER